MTRVAVLLGRFLTQQHPAQKQPDLSKVTGQRSDPPPRNAG